VVGISRGERERLVYVAPAFSPASFVNQSVATSRDSSDGSRFLAFGAALSAGFFLSVL
jgi:hypothetical protein